MPVTYLLKLPKELHQAWKLAAKRQRRTMRQFLLIAIEHALADEKRKSIDPPSGER